MPLFAPPWWSYPNYNQYSNKHRNYDTKMYRSCGAFVCVVVCVAYKKFSLTFWNQSKRAGSLSGEASGMLYQCAAPATS